MWNEVNYYLRLVNLRGKRGNYGHNVRAPGYLAMPTADRPAWLKLSRLLRRRRSVWRQHRQVETDACYFSGKIITLVLTT